MRKKILHKKIAVWLPLVFILFFQFQGLAQFDQGDEEGLPPPDNNEQKIIQPELIDTLILSSFTFDNIEENKAYHDSILHYRFNQYNPLYEKEIPYLYLGNLGSAATPLKQILEPTTGLDFGFHQYDAYKMNLDSFRWFRTNVPFADLYFGAGKSESEFRVQSKFTKNFPGGWNLNIDYERILNEGYYKYQSVKQSSLTVGFWHKSKDNRSNTFITFLTNIHEESNNGGIYNPDELLFDNYAIRLNVPVILSTSENRQQNNKFTARNYFKLLKKKDSLNVERKFQISLVNEIEYENGFLKFYDDNTSLSADSSYYGPLLVDSKGLRNYISFNKFSLNPGLQFSFNKRSTLRSGLRYDLWSYNYEPSDAFTKSDIKFWNKLRIVPFKNAEANFKLDYYLGAYFGDLNMSGNIRFGFRKYFDLFAEQKLIRKNPGIIQNSLWISGQEVFKNDFDISTHGVTNLGLAIPVIGFRITANYHTVNKYIYYDKELAFTQDEGINNFISLKISESLSFKGFHFDNSLHLFQSDASFVDLPLFYLDSKLYYHNHIWKNRMLLDTGIEFFLQEGSKIPAYQALTGSFYYQEDYESSTFPLLNLYASFKVSSFRIYIRSENILSLINNDVFYQAKYYPQNDFKTFRIGIRWLFLN